MYNMLDMHITKILLLNLSWLCKYYVDILYWNYAQQICILKVHRKVTLSWHH